MSDNTPPPPSNTQQTPSHPSRPFLCPLSFPNLHATPSPTVQYLPPRLITKPNGKTRACAPPKYQNQRPSSSHSERSTPEPSLRGRQITTTGRHRRSKHLPTLRRRRKRRRRKRPRRRRRRTRREMIRTRSWASIPRRPPPPGTSRKSNARIGISRGGATPTSPSGRTRRRGNGRRRTHTSRASTRRTRL